MKKVFAVMAIVGMFAFVACGPKAEEKSAEEATEQVQEAAEARTETATEVAATVDSTGAVADSAAVVAH